LFGLVFSVGSAFAGSPVESLVEKIDKSESLAIPSWTLQQGITQIFEYLWRLTADQRLEIPLIA